MFVFIVPQYWHPLTIHAYHRGGGIAGLTFALALCKGCHDVVIDVYEAGPKFSEVGAGLNMWPRVLEIFRDFGIEDDLKQYVESPTQSTFDVHHGLLSLSLSLPRRKADEIPQV